MFKQFLNLRRAETEVEKLEASVIYGWGLVGIGFLSFLISFSLKSILYPSIITFLAYIWLFTFLLFLFRYTSTKPFLGAAAGGISVITLGSILDNMSRRNDGSYFLGALIGVLFMIFLILIKNFFVSWYYLIKETIRFSQSKHNKISLEDTVVEL